MLHGGAIMSLADSGGGLCAFLNLPEDAKGTATIESKTNFFGAVREGHVTATSRPLHKGKTTIVVETDVHDAERPPRRPRHPDAGRASLAAERASSCASVKQIWQGRAAQVVTKYGEQAPMAAVCCNACRTCVTTNVVGLATAALAAAATPPSASPSASREPRSYEKRQEPPAAYSLRIRRLTTMRCTSSGPVVDARTRGPA